MYDELIKRLRNCTAEQNGEKTLWCQAADAIEKLRGLCANQSKDCSEAVAKYLELLVKQPRWIPVTERLPEGEKDVLVWISVGETPIVAYDVDCYNEHAKRWVCFENNVTHWMPLPDPPKEEA